MQFAELSGSGAADVDFFTGGGATRRGQLQGIRIDHYGLHALGHLEVPDVAVTRQSGGFDHEIGPNGCGCLATLQAQVVIVVKTDPDDADEIAGEAGKPAVARCACFARRR